MGLDLTTISTTFPDLPQLEISRDNIISWIKDRFGNENRAIAVQGTVGAGKTTLLSQFAKTFPDRCFSFFIGTTLRTSHPAPFLVDLCEQLARVLGERSETLRHADSDTLEYTFAKWQQTLAYYSRKTKRNFYFVIDGLEWIPPDSQGEALLRLLPHPPSNAGIFLLVSSDPARVLRFNFEAVKIPPFSVTETETYLSGLGLLRDQALLVHQNCGGHPGYLAAVRRLLLSGAKPEEFSERMPTEVRDLYDIEWSRAKVDGSDLVFPLALIAYSKESLTFETIAGLVSLNVDYLRERVSSVPFLQLNRDSRSVQFISDTYKQFAAMKLELEKDKAIGVLIDHYSQSPYSRSTLMLLPRILAETGAHERLRGLVSNDHLTRALERVGDIGIMRNSLSLVANIALKSNDFSSLPRYTLAGSILQTLSREASGEDEIDALLELGEFDRALEIAYHALLPHDKLQMLAKVCAKLKATSSPIPLNVMRDLEEIAATVDPSVLRQRAVDIAAVLFEVTPSLAVQFIERSAEGQSLDQARALLAVRLEEKASGEIHARITDQKLRDFARAYSPRVGSLTADEVIAEADAVTSTGGKLHLLRAWCNENRDDPSAYRAVEKAIEAITADPSYGPSMRLLRQLAEPLAVTDQPAASKLVARLDLIKQTARNEPPEEAIRLELLVSAHESRRSQETGIARFREVYAGLQAIEALDIRCYCLARTLMALPQIDRDDSLKLGPEIKRRLVADYGQLIEASAEQYEITRPLLRALVSYDERLALEFGDMLNTSDRRDKAYRDILLSYAQRNLKPVEAEFIDTLLDRISDPPRREVVTVELLEKLSEWATPAIPAPARVTERIPGLLDPTNQSYACAFAIKDLTRAGRSDLAGPLSSRLPSALGRIDALWERVSAGFRLASVLGQSAPALARALLENARQEKQTSILAESRFAQMYIDSLRLALRAFSAIIAGDAEHATRREELLRMISLLPSVRYQGQLAAELALRYRLEGKDDEFQILVNQHLLTYLQRCSDPGERRQLAVSIAPCLFEYDPTLTLRELSELPVSMRERALTRIVKFIISRAIPGEPVDLDAIKTNMDLRRSNQVVQLVGEMESDSEIFETVHLFVRSLVRQGPGGREICAPLIERNALIIADELQTIVHAKLPDPRNIRQTGN